MRCLFFYHQDGAASVGSNPPWDPKKEATNKFVGEQGLQTEGYFYLLKQMFDKKIIDDLIIFIESNRGPGFKSIKGVPCYVIPTIDYAEKFLKKDDVIFIRGGFRTWWQFIERIKHNHWLMLYAANTGRARWTFWDVVLNDLEGKFYLDGRQRFHFYFKKPTHPGIFFPIKTERIYDVCVGSSYIHDRKGQWKIIDAIYEYQNKYKKRLKCIMPGAFRHGTESNKILNKIKKWALDVNVCGMLPRHELCKVYNQSKLMIHMCAGGQNDRGPIEAMACGTPVIVSGTANRGPYTYENSNVALIAGNDLSMNITHMLLNQCDEENRQYVADYYESVAGMDTVILPEMRRLFDVFKNNKKPNPQALVKEFC